MLDHDKTLWFKRNKAWLMKWFDEYEEVDIPPGKEQTMQIFRVFIPQSQIYRLDEYLAQHKIEIIMSAVFSLPTTTTTPFGVLSTMDGFLNQTGRLPTKKDKITFESPSGADTRFMSITKSQDTEGSPGFTLLSECRIKIN
ncbi:MAG: hypothetical protein IPJ03_16265 [Ignavibacteriales bacterium]|nr:hypothetical protein [Ignavibacteriales bacterium]